MTIDIKVPDLGEGIEEGDVLNVLVREGDVIQPEQGIVELETDKAVAEVPSPRGGRVTKVHVKPGDSVAVGGVLVTLEEKAAEAKPAVVAESKSPVAAAQSVAKPEPAAPAPARNVSPPPKQPPTKAKPSSAPTSPAIAPASHTRAPAARESSEESARPGQAARPSAPAVKSSLSGDTAAADVEERHSVGFVPSAAGPAVRRFARELGVDLARVHGTGPGGRITREDILSTVRAANRAAAVIPPSAMEVGASDSAPPSGAVLPPGEPARDKWGPVRRDRVSKIRATIAARMQQSVSTIPHVTNFDDADTTELERIRQSSKADYAANGVRLTTLPFVIKAVAQALRRHPLVNASLDLEAGEIVYKQYVNIGLAVDTERGLIVPNIRGVELMGIPQIAQAVEDIAARARDNNYTVDDLRGGTFTISNLGAIGGTYSTPIINPPEVAVLLVGRSRQMPVAVDDRVEVRLMLPLSLSYDHRLVDGATAARFLNDVKGYLEAPGRLLLAP